MYVSAIHAPWRNDQDYLCNFQRVTREDRGVRRNLRKKSRRSILATKQCFDNTIKNKCYGVRVCVNARARARVSLRCIQPPPYLFLSFSIVRRGLSVRMRAKKGAPQQNLARIYRRCPNSTRYCVTRFRFTLPRGLGSVALSHPSYGYLSRYACCIRGVPETWIKYTKRRIFYPVNPCPRMSRYGQSEWNNRFSLNQ